MLLLSHSVTTVAIPIISLLSALSLAMRKSARKLGKYGQRHGTLREAEVVEAVEVEVAAEVVQVMGLVLKGSVLLGTIQQKSSNSGVMMINGAWKMLCNKGCGWNESYTTKYHDERQRSVATFKVPPHHPYWLLLGKPYTTAAVAAGVLSPSVAGGTQVQTSASVLASLTGVIDRHITNVESAEMSSFLGELCNKLEN
jgi:hypothetical protein